MESSNLRVINAAVAYIVLFNVLLCFLMKITIINQDLCKSTFSEKITVVANFKGHSRQKGSSGVRVASVTNSNDVRSNPAILRNLVADTQLYKRLCPTVRPSVCRSVRRSVV